MILCFTVRPTAKKLKLVNLSYVLLDQSLVLKVKCNMHNLHIA